MISKIFVVTDYENLIAQVLGANDEFANCFSNYNPYLSLIIDTSSTGNEELILLKKKLLLVHRQK